MREATQQRMDSFLKEVERRAFRMAQVSTQSEADALDILQETMIKFVDTYSDRSDEEWRPLFFKILEHKILDWHRKETLKKRLFFWRHDTKTSSEDEQPLEHAIQDRTDGEADLIGQQLSQRLVQCIESLPLKQQQCFMLRSWEGLSIRDTASAMNINENSVKTHYSRALEKLKVLYQHFEQGEDGLYDQ